MNPRRGTPTSSRRRWTLRRPRKRLDFGGFDCNWLKAVYFRLDLYGGLTCARLAHGDRFATGKTEQTARVEPSGVVAAMVVDANVDPALAVFCVCLELNALPGGKGWTDGLGEAGDGCGSFAAGRADHARRRPKSARGERGGA